MFTSCIMLDRVVCALAPKAAGHGRGDQHGHTPPSNPPIPERAPSDGEEAWWADQRKRSKYCSGAVSTRTWKYRNRPTVSLVSDALRDRSSYLRCYDQLCSPLETSTNGIMHSTRKRPWATLRECLLHGERGHSMRGKEVQCSIQVEVECAAKPICPDSNTRHLVTL